MAGASGAVPRVLPTRIPEARWEELKWVIVELYVDRNMTITQVKMHMEQVHGFSATYVGVWQPSSI
jgi:hypothetical protein